MYRTLFLVVMMLAIALPGSFIHAQTLGAEPLTLSVSPKYPRPFDTVTVTVSSTLLNLAASTISISADGVVVEEGERTARVRVGAAGTKTTISTTVVANGKTYQKQLIVSPAEVMLIMEPQTTAHPLYEGARLVAPESRVRLIALADLKDAKGVRIPAASLSYTWRLGNQILNDHSGLGKNVLDATAPVRYRDAEVSVTVTTQNLSQNAYASVFVSPVTPVVRIYENDPLRGLLSTRALAGSFTLAGSEQTFRAIPYFFKNTPALSWTLNGAPSGTDNDVTVRTTGASAGTASIGVVATDAQASEQAESRFTLQFGSGSTNIFGF